jgi:hypothetical protein
VRGVASTIRPIPAVPGTTLTDVPAVGVGNTTGLRVAQSWVDVTVDFCVADEPITVIPPFALTLIQRSTWVVLAGRVQAAFVFDVATDRSRFAFCYAVPHVAAFAGAIMKLVIVVVETFCVLNATAAAAGTRLDALILRVSDVPFLAHALVPLRTGVKTLFSRRAVAVGRADCCYCAIETVALVPWIANTFRFSQRFVVEASGVRVTVVNLCTRNSRLFTAETVPGEALVANTREAFRFRRVDTLGISMAVVEDVASNCKDIFYY